jgi:hypothetical protein
MSGLTRRGSRCSEPEPAMRATAAETAGRDAAAERGSPATPHFEQRDLLHLSLAFPGASSAVILEAYEAAGRNVLRAEQALLARFGDAPRTTSAHGEVSEPRQAGGVGW